MTSTIELTTTWARACAVSDLEPGWGEAALRAELHVAERGAVSVGDKKLVRYDLGTGECFTDPALWLRTYRTRVIGGMIEIELDG